MPKINKKLVDSLPPEPDRDYWVWDGDLPGFGIRVWPSGRKVYVAQYRAEGRTRRVGLGTHGAVTPNEARKAAMQTLAEVSKGGNPAEAKSHGRTAPTVKRLADRYLTEHAGPKKKSSSLSRDQRLIERFILPAMGRKRVEAVSRSDVAQLHHQVGKSTPIQANRTLAVLSKMMTLAINWGMRPEALGNPCRHIERFKERKRERFLSPDELARLGAALTELEQESSELPSVITAVRLLVFTGCRREEILSLKWEHVDFERKCIRLPESKTGAKVVPLGPPALEILATIPRLEDNPYVCPGVKPGQHLVGLPRAWARIQKRAGLERVRIHDLRHSFASVGAAAGLGLPIIGAILGHTQAATTQRYAHLANDPLQAAAEEITQRIAEAMSSKFEPKLISLHPKN